MWVPLILGSTLSAIAISAPLQAFPRSDGFIYPGQPGSQGVVAYNRRWDSFAARLRRLGKASAPDMSWIIGRWKVVVRDYDFHPPASGGVEVVGQGSASVGAALGGKWLLIESQAGRWSQARYLGFDAAERRWVLWVVTAPGVDDGSPAYAKGWGRGRLVFGPVHSNYHGLGSVDRISIVREGPDRFRIVTEARMLSGRFVAVDDTLFERTR